MTLWMLVTSIVLLTGFKKNTDTQNILSDKPATKINHDGIFTEPVKVSIADARAVKGDKGQRPVKVMVYLSKATTEPVTVKYSTEDGVAKAGADYVATKGSITFQPGEVAKWINVLIIGEVAADPDEDAPPNQVAGFVVKITEATGVIIDMARAYITIIQYVAGNLSLSGAGTNQAVYEVIISYTGYTSFSGTAAECGIRKDGIVVLSGLLMGRENIKSYDDITYTGNLEMIIDMDICSVDRPPGNSEDRLCGIRVEGSGTVFTELKINYDTETDGRGGYIQIENKDGRFRRVVTGDCGEQVDEEWTMVPNKSISSIFNGQDLPMLLRRTLHVGQYTETDDHGNVTVVDVLRKIR